MSEFQPLTFRAAVLRARAMTPEERLTEAFRLTEDCLRDFANLPESEKARLRQQLEEEENLYYGPPVPR